MQCRVAETPIHGELGVFCPDAKHGGVLWCVVF